MNCNALNSGAWTANNGELEKCRSLLYIQTQTHGKCWTVVLSYSLEPS